jgi:hypothetical protein
LIFIKYLLFFSTKNKRFTAEQCLKHPYLASTNAKLVECNESFDWSFDTIPEKKMNIQRAIYQAALEFCTHTTDNDQVLVAS